MKKQRSTNYDFITISDITTKNITSKKGNQVEILEFMVLANKKPIFPLSVFVNTSDDGSKWGKIENVFSEKLNKYVFKRTYYYEVQMRVNSLLYNYFHNGESNEATNKVIEAAPVIIDNATVTSEPDVRAAPKTKTNIVNWEV